METTIKRNIGIAALALLGFGLTASMLVDAPPLMDSTKTIRTDRLGNETRIPRSIEEEKSDTIQLEALTSAETFLTENEVTFAPVISRLMSEGVDSAFIASIIHHPKTKFNDKFVKINVTGYLKKPDYSSHYNARSVAKAKAFLEENNEILHKAEAKYGVTAEAITSILWVETRHGGYTGNNQLPSVFLSTALANEDEYLDMNLKVLEEEHKEGTSEYKKLKKKILSRAERKSNWALEQLVAMSKINERLPVPVTEIEGSWAGAFGWSQFLPSSYENWAVDGNDDGEIDLFDKEDAIFSVANYLKEHGWGKTNKAQRKAVWGYNHSNDYVDAVLKLADKIKG